MMAKARWLKGEENITVKIKCPGCGDSHFLNVDPSKSPCWQFNGNMEKPTFTPSILYKTGKYVEGDNYKKRLPVEDHAWYERYSKICHSFVTDGNIQLLSDCTHENAGKTMELLDVS